jgi:PKD repeat protein
MYRNKSLKSIFIILFLLSLVCTVQATAPVANFTSNVTLGTSPLTVQFNDTSTNSPTGWSWFFGDEPYNQSWVVQNASSRWNLYDGLSSHTSETFSNGLSIVMGGYTNSDESDNVWGTLDKGVTWFSINQSAWAIRELHESVILPDDSVLVLGGHSYTEGTYAQLNDVWRSTDHGSTWVEQNSSAGWTKREAFGSAVLLNGSVLVFGGQSYEGNPDYGQMNDTWISSNNGSTWSQLNNAPWEERYQFGTATLHDGSVVVIGGYGPDVEFQELIYTDAWRTADGGGTWTLMNSSVPLGLYYDNFRAITMPDDSIIVFSCDENAQSTLMLRSTDKGATWTDLSNSPGAGWHFDTTILNDGSMMMTGGRWDDSNYAKRTLRFNATSSLVQNATHTYTGADGQKFTVTLRAYNAQGWSDAIKTDYITIGSGVIAPLAQFIKNWASNTVLAPRTVQFNDTSLNSPTSYNWTCGGNPPTYATGRNQTCYFNMRGWRNVTLTATNSAGSSTNFTVMHVI